jgi:hypothetical protein
MSEPPRTAEQMIVACLEKVLAAFGQCVTLNFIGPEWYYVEGELHDEPVPPDAASNDTLHTGTAS